MEQVKPYKATHFIFGYENVQKNLDDQTDIRLRITLKMRLILCLNFWSRFHKCKTCGKKWFCSNPLDIVCRNSLHRKRCLEHMLNNEATE